MRKVSNFCIKSLELFRDRNKYTRIDRIKTKIQFEQIIININKKTSVLLSSNNENFREQQHNL